MAIIAVTCMLSYLGELVISFAMTATGTLRMLLQKRNYLRSGVCSQPPLATTTAAVDRVYFWLAPAALLSITTMATELFPIRLIRLDYDSRRANSSLAQY